MYHKPEVIRHNRQRGVSLPAILVIIIVMGIISAALVNLTATSQLEVGNDVVSLRAFLAAEGGAQNGMARLFPLGGGAANCNAFTINYATPSLNGCTANVTCAGPVTFNGRDMYTLSSTGQCTLGATVSVRTLQVGARSP